jgi:hypothetical protein
MSTHLPFAPDSVSDTAEGKDDYNIQVLLEVSRVAGNLTD